MTNFEAWKNFLTEQEISYTVEGDIINGIQYQVLHVGTVNVPSGKAGYRTEIIPELFMYYDSGRPYLEVYFDMSGRFTGFYPDRE